MERAFFYPTFAVFGFCLVFIVAVAVQRLYFHPLSRVPGPFLAKITGLYAGHQSWRGTMHLDVQRCHKRYGDIIRYGPNQVLSLHNPDFSAIYAHGKPFRKSKGYATMIVEDNGWSTMTCIDKELHHDLRRTFRSGLGADWLSRYEPAVPRNLDVLLGQLTAPEELEDGGWSRAADMRKWGIALGFDTMAEYGLGLGTGLLRDAQARSLVIPAIHVHQQKMGLWEQLPGLSNTGVSSLVGWLLLVVSPRARRFAAWYADFLDRALAHNSGAGVEGGIFAPIIRSGLGLSSSIPKARLAHNRAQMVWDVTTSTFTAGDAYGIMLAAFLHHVGRNRVVYDRLAAEVRAAFPDGQVAYDFRLEQLTFLSAVIDEVMRVVPPACGVHWRECEAAVGVTVGPTGGGAVRLPRGFDVGMSLFAIFRDGRVFRDPLRFWPERWLPGVLPEEEHRRARKAFNPFLIGPRNCVGGHVGVRIAQVAFAWVMANYDFRLAQEEPDWTAGGLLWSNAEPEEPGADAELRFESHYSITSWDSGPFVQFKKRAI